MVFNTMEGEKVIKQGKANKTGLFQGQGGELILTNKRLVFLGHGMNVGNDAASANIEDIMSFGKAFTFIIWAPIPVPNAIRVLTKQGKALKFTVYGRKKWIKELEQLFRK